ncbi:DoxX family membrane protein [uncultured Aquimarina sp.]|uniref:DoxX family membrane protein n=1 Tax=uncultured Aquimarina sp. TaxID=575652 RepID=UPI002615C369|nr:DoxX family membrane protein [uncultured Aquimarina sp.]
MKFRIYLYTLVRVLFGIFLALHSTYNVFFYSEFLQKIDAYFTKATLFNYNFIEALAPLVPFEEFIVGMFLTLGFFTRKVLMGAALLFLFLAFFLLDANSLELALVHLVFFFIILILWHKENYNLKSMDYLRNSYLVI